MSEACTQRLKFFVRMALSCSGFVRIVWYCSSRNSGLTEAPKQGFDFTHVTGSESSSRESWV